LRVGAAEELSPARHGDRWPERREDGPPLRRACGLAEREQPAVPVARRGDAREPVSRVVAVTARRRSDAGRERVVLNSAYVRALAAAGLVPAIVPPQLAPAAAGPLLDAAAGLVLTGGEDVDPACYGAVPHPRLGETDPGRDAMELALIAGARDRKSVVSGTSVERWVER